MKLRPFAIAMPVATGSFFLAATLLTAGPLDPPLGTIAPTYKTLNEVEPRIALSLVTTPGDADSVLRITTPGSYYLTGNLDVSAAGMSAIEIAASNVAIDLNGYQVSSSTGVAVIRCSLDSAVGITIRNGSITGGGGIDLAATNVIASERGLIERVNVDRSSGAGIRTGPNYTIDKCRISLSSLDGIVVGVHSIISNIAANSNSRSGLVAGGSVIITDSVAAGNTENGFKTGESTVFSRCLAMVNGIDGFVAGRGSTVEACTARNNAADGYDLVGTTMTASMALHNDAGFRGVECTVRGCSMINNDYGVECDRSSVIECTINSNTLRGIRCVNDSELIDCVVTGGHTGIMVGNNCTVRGNTSNAHNGGPSVAMGIYVLGSDNVIEDNVCNDNDYGMIVEATGNTIRRNSCSGSHIMAWSIVAGNNLAPIVFATPNNVAVNGNSYGGNMGSVDPAANYTY